MDTNDGYESSEEEEELDDEGIMQKMIKSFTGNNGEW